MIKMKILIACEYSGRVRDAFLAKGHDATSCDILPTESPGPHYQGDVLDILDDGWDMMIAFPDCTYLTYAANRVWNSPGRLEKRLAALNFFALLWLAPIDKICIENPEGCASPTIAKYSQTIQPFHFGDPFSKATCLWLKKLSLLEHNPHDTLFDKGTHVEYETTKRLGNWYNKGGKERSKIRSRTFPGIANAMAEQWG